MAEHYELIIIALLSHNLELPKKALNTKDSRASPLHDKLYKVRTGLRGLFDPRPSLRNNSTFRRNRNSFL